MATSKSGVSALELQRTLGISNYQSVWEMLFRLRQAMGVGAKEHLGGTVEVDESFLGGAKSGNRGRGALGKVMVAVAVEHAGTGGLGRVRMQVIPNAKASTLAAFLAATVEPGAVVVTDGFMPYRTATTGYVHKVHVVHGSGPRPTNCFRPFTLSSRSPRDGSRQPIRAASSPSTFLPISTSSCSGSTEGKRVHRA